MDWNLTDFNSIYLLSPRKMRRGKGMLKDNDVKGTTLIYLKV